MCSIVDCLVICVYDLSRFLMISFIFLFIQGRWSCSAMVFGGTNVSIPKVIAIFSSFHKSFDVLMVAVFIIVSVASHQYFLKFSVSVFL